MNEKQIKELMEAQKLDLIETHISWLLLSDEYVYKIKKPLRFSFLDFSTLEKRKFLCEEEVRLNRRLSPDVYLGVVPITEEDGQLTFEGKGEAIDYAVKMKRLPQERLMDGILQRGEVNSRHIEEIAGIVADFHKKIEVIKDKKYSSADVVRQQIDDLENHKKTIEEACGLGEKVDFILERSDAFIEGNGELFEKRQDQGMIRDCHGDLHSANIFITERIVIFDCIEFSKDFRFIDVASEIAFMAMDLGASGREDFSKLFVERYIELSGDGETRKMLGIYKCYRANVRAKIAAIDYSQHPGDEPKERIEKYIRLAEKYASLL
jgi:aminoglycoside phosphotransferase family enzyme